MKGKRKEYQWRAFDPEKQLFERFLIFFTSSGPCPITNIQSSFSFSFFQIESLDLSHNAISFVHARAFDLATNLRSLDMSGNRLQTTSLSTFQPLQSLQSLNLAFNSNFSSLPSRSFSSLEALASLNLSSCGLTSVSTDTFIGLSSSLVVLDLSNNSIESSDELGIRYLDSLQQLFAGRNRIQVMRRGCFKELSKLSSLDLSDTRSLLKIEDLAFVGNSALSNLILDGCDGLSMLESKALASSSTIDSGNERQLHLSLRRQRWSHLPSYMEKLSWDQVSSIDLSDNPLECDCHVAWLNKLLVSTQGSSSLVNASNIPCAFPADLAGLELAQLNASQLICEQEKEVSHMFNPSTRAPGDLFQIILVSVCVLTALLTGLVVLFVVHCRKQRCRIKSLFRRRGDHQDMAFDSPLDNCSCCDIRANGELFYCKEYKSTRNTCISGKLLRLQPPSLHGGDHFFRHDGHQPLRPASAFYLDNGHGSIYRPSYNGHSLRQGHLSRGKIRQQIHQTETNPRHSSRFEEESDFFNTLNSKSTLCLDEEQDDYFLSFSASREHTYVRPIPVSEL